MANAILKGHISFGLVSIPIALYSSEDKTVNISFHQIDKRDKARIKYKRMNVETNKEVPWEEVGRAYEYTKNEIIPVKEGELQKIAGENAKTIAIESFIDKKNLEFIMINKTYYLVPEKKGLKGYIILREALKNTNKIGIAKLLITSKEYLAAVTVYKNALVIYILRYANEIRNLANFSLPEDNINKYKVTNKEISVAEKLIQSMTEKWNPTKYKDEFKIEVEKWLNHKLKHLPLRVMKNRDTAIKSHNVVNFMDLLKKSVKEKTSTKNDRNFKIKKHPHKTQKT